MRFASFTSGITSMSCSSSLCMLSSCCRWSSSCAWAFLAFSSSSLMRRSAASSARSCFASNSALSLCSSCACSCAWRFACSAEAACSAAAAACSLAMSAACFSSAHSCCFRSIWRRNSSSRCFRSASASLLAWLLASSASRTRRSSSSASLRLASSSSSLGPVISPCAAASSLRAISKVTAPEKSSSLAPPFSAAGSTKTKMFWQKATRSPCASSTPRTLPSRASPFTKVVDIAPSAAVRMHVPWAFVMVACSCWMPAPASVTCGASSPPPRPMRCVPSLKEKRSLFMSISSSLRLAMWGTVRSTLLFFCVAAFWASSSALSWLRCICSSMSSSCLISVCLLCISSAEPWGPPSPTISRSLLFSSRSCRISLSCGFSLTTAEFLMRFALSA
mmetsp:Transcript_33393/g.99168  ORF Transcript_33393/g.99168 Transcript_33393/m.99168 type:complete len:391 (+) Transcript_33393:765-1937(+)